MFGVANSFVNQMLPQWTIRTLSDKEMENYRAPFPTIRSRKAMQVFPADVPVNGKPVFSHTAIQNYYEWLQESAIPKLCFHADPGMLIRPDDADWISQNFPNTEMIKLGVGSHFVQEDHPHVIGSCLAQWYLEITNNAIA